ncbi:MAG: HAMP domain-containing protein, partial [Treponema sp.]|nr:HAMP domain-containing protein [Treponema sp.]
MKTQRPRPKFSIINVSGLILIYFLLIVLTILFSRSFMSDLLENGQVPGLSVLAVFFVIPAVMLIILLYSGAEIARDILTREPGGRFQIRLLAYFFIVVILAATPVTTITSLSVSELLRFWNTIDVDTAMNEAQRFAMESYSMNLDRLRQIAEADFGDSAPAVSNLPEGILAVQDFGFYGSGWMETGFTGSSGSRLSAVPSEQKGFAPRELPRDTDVIRYVVFPAADQLRVITMDLGKGFDDGIKIIENEKNRFSIINSVRLNIRRLFVFYYGVFFLPAILMTMIIAISFSRRVAFPIEELGEATRKVADGDFSIRILPRKGDELALL